MPKTKLNEKFDDFFKRYQYTLESRNIKVEQVTNIEKILEEHLDITETNEYGNILHAVVNYDYPKDIVKQIITGLLNLGVDPNYRGQRTGMSFLHLMFYGYTDNNNIDHSYQEDFLIDIIKIAIQHGFDVNILDGDRETIAVSAVASEVYTGSVLNILKSLGANYKIDESFITIFNKYLKEAKKSDSSWYNRLEKEKEQVVEYVKSANLCLEDIEANLKNILKSLSGRISQLNYESLVANYELIAQEFNDINDYIMKKRNLEAPTSVEEKKTKSFTNTVTNVLKKEITSIEKNPNTHQINQALKIVTCFNYPNFIERLEKIKSEYEEYLTMLKEKALNVDTITHAQAFLKEVAMCEIFSELASIVNTKISEINEHADSLIEAHRSLQELNSLLSEFVSITDSVDTSYEDKTIEQIDTETARINHIKENYKEELLEYITSSYSQVLTGLTKLIEEKYLTKSDLRECFNKSLSLTPKDDKLDHELK